MIVMPANATGWFFHALARETGRLGHLYSPGAQRGPWPWFPFALDNGAFAAWDRATNEVNEATLAATRAEWQRLLVWAQASGTQPLWAVVPDVPGDAERTLSDWRRYAGDVTRCPRALAVQDGMTPEQVRQLEVQPDVIAVGGTTDWKWSTVASWAAAFPRVHVLRCNSPAKLYELEALGVESCDGTGWNRGDRTQTRGLEEWARSRARPITTPMTPFVSRATRNPDQESFA